MPTRKTPGRTMSQAQVQQMYENERRVMELRIKGLSFAAINKETKLSNSRKIFQRAISRDANADVRRAESLRLEELRLDQLQEGIWGRALQGEPRAVEVALKVLERRAKMFGLDFADLISGKMVEIEQAKVAMVADALTAALRESGADSATVRRAEMVFLSKIRESGADKYAAANFVPPEPGSLVTAVAGAEVVEGQVISGVDDADDDEDLLS